MSNCKLCKIRVANKKNSHILPKFLGKSMLKQPNGKHSGIKLAISNKYNSTKIKKIQDIHKVDNIFCTECEKSLEILETYAAKNLFVKLKSQTERIQLDSKIIQFLSSLVWRVSLDSNKYTTALLSDRLSENLRTIILSEAVKCEFEFQIYFCKENIPTHNLINAVQNDQFSLIYLNELVILTFFDSNNDFFAKQNLVNNINYLSLDEWRNIQSEYLNKTFNWLKIK